MMQKEVMPVPGFNGQHGATAKDGWSYAINKTSKEKDTAWDFLKFITIDPAGNGEFCKAQGRPSPIASVNDDPVYTEDMGEMWTNLVASMNKDVVLTVNIYADTVKPWLRDFPARRIAGESVEDIMEDIHEMFQSFLDDVYN